MNEQTETSYPRTFTAAYGPEYAAEQDRLLGETLKRFEVIGGDSYEMPTWDAHLLKSGEVAVVFDMGTYARITVHQNRAAYEQWRRQRYSLSSYDIETGRKGW